MYLKIKLMVPDDDPSQLEAVKAVLDAHNLDKPIAITIGGKIAAAYVLDYEER
jgi:hypothetical protein